MPSFENLLRTDPETHAILQAQIRQESSTLKLIASENFVSSAVLEATGTVFTNKYSEGYPGARYYEGTEIADQLENLAINRLKALFGVEHANVQPYSGSPANQAVCRAVLQHGDTVMGLPVPQGGHLTHGWGVNFSGQDYRRVPYNLNPETERIDYDELRSLALKERPKLIWVGGTAYPRLFDYEAAASIAREVDAYLVADIAHIAGLIAGGAIPSPVAHCDIVSSTTHKTLRGPRGGIIMSRIADRYQDKYHANTKFNLAKRVDRAVFPGLQGGPHLNSIAALAVALQEASQPAFRDYAAQVVKNAKALADALLARGYRLTSGGTDNHLLIVDLRAAPESGKVYAKALSEAGLITNFNTVPNDPRPPAVSSGIRMGSAGVTSMGMGEAEMSLIADWFDRVCKAPADAAVKATVRGEIAEVCGRFKVPGIRE
jgi:glycine hydroxymethyltransferase